MKVVQLKILAFIVIYTSQLMSSSYAEDDYRRKELEILKEKQEIKLSKIDTFIETAKPMVELKEVEATSTNSTATSNTLPPITYSKSPFLHQLMHIIDKYALIAAPLSLVFLFLAFRYFMNDVNPDLRWDNWKQKLK